MNKIRGYHYVYSDGTTSSGCVIANNIQTARRLFEAIFTAMIRLSEFEPKRVKYWGTYYFPYNPQTVVEKQLGRIKVIDGNTLNKFMAPHDKV